MADQIVKSDCYVANHQGLTEKFLYIYSYHIELWWTIYVLLTHTWFYPKGPVGQPHIQLSLSHRPLRWSNNSLSSSICILIKFTKKWFCMLRLLSFSVCALQFNDVGGMYVQSHIDMASILSVTSSWRVSWLHS